MTGMSAFDMMGDGDLVGDLVGATAATAAGGVASYAFFIAGLLNEPLRAGCYVAGVSLILGAAIWIDRLPGLHLNDGTFTLSTGAVIGALYFFTTDNAVHPGFERHYDSHDQINQSAATAQKKQKHERQSHERRIDVRISPDTATHPGEHAVGSRTI